MFKNVLKLKFLSVFPKLSYPERKISLAFPLLIANMELAVMVGQHLHMRLSWLEWFGQHLPYYSVMVWDGVQEFS
jgi:hypothetical protein